MKGGIFSDQVCPACRSRFKSDEPRGLFCPQHQEQSPKKYVVRYGKITRRFNNYEAAYQFLTGLRYQEGSGKFDCRDYQIKARPLSFNIRTEEWLEIKNSTLKPRTWSVMCAGMRHFQNAWGQANVKNIDFAMVQNFFLQHQGASKTKANLLAYLKQFMTWAHDRYDIPLLRKWPNLGPIEMGFRKTIDLKTQENILNEIKRSNEMRVWLAVKWLATYISIRPGEMRSLNEEQLDRASGLIVIPHPKEKRPKVIPLTEEDKEIVRKLPLPFNKAMPFFRLEKTGQRFGIGLLYEVWKRATAKFGITDVDLYGGTKHSTAMGLRDSLTFEQVRTMTQHTTNKAFERYFRTEGSALSNLYAQRKTVINLITG